MFQHFLYLFVCFVIVLCTSELDDVVKSITKRSDIDVQTCIENFAIHRDKIIRTQDSRNMGAKYLNEIDLGSREECLRLCCETDTCDVFVYEEKVFLFTKQRTCMFLFSTVNEWPWNIYILIYCIVKQICSKLKVPHAWSNLLCEYDIEQAPIILTAIGIFQNILLTFAETILQID